MLNEEIKKQSEEMKLSFKIFTEEHWEEALAGHQFSW